MLMDIIKNVFAKSIVITTNFVKAIRVLPFIESKQRCLCVTNISPTEKKDKGNIKKEERLLFISCCHSLFIQK